MIIVTYSSIDGCKKTKTYQTLAGAQKFAQYWVGETPDLGSFYAVSFDGVGKVTCSGCPLIDLFPALKAQAEALADQETTLAACDPFGVPKTWSLEP
jgi:hypothetical protein